MNRYLKDLRRMFDEVRKKNGPRPGQHPYTMPEKKTVQDIMKALRVRN